MCKKIIFSLFTLLIGILIYYLSYKNQLIKVGYISSFTRNYIPDILWTLSFYTACTIFSKNITILLTAVYVIIIGIIFELLQYTGKVRGTFDYYDIIVYIVFSFIASLIEKYYWRDKIWREK